MLEMSRRTFLMLAAGTGAAMATEPGGKFVTKLIPYVNQPEDVRTLQ